MKSMSATSSIAGLAVLLCIAAPATALKPSAHKLDRQNVAHSAHRATSFLATRRDLKGQWKFNDAEEQAVIQAAEAAAAGSSIASQSVSADSAGQTATASVIAKTELPRALNAGKADSYLLKAKKTKPEADEAEKAEPADADKEGEAKKASKEEDAESEEEESKSEEGDEKSAEKDDDEEKQKDEGKEESKEESNDEATEGESSDDAEEEETTEAAQAPAPANKASKVKTRRAAPAPAVAAAEEEDDDEEDEDDKKPLAEGDQAPVVAVVTIKNVDYELLSQDQSLHAAVEAAVKKSVADAAGDDIDGDDVSIVSWAGSIRARAVIKPAEGVSSDDVVSELQNTSSLRAAITERVKKIRGIGMAQKGDIGCEVDVLVANKVSSVSKVMSRAKGHKHLSRVYELEKKAAAERQEITDIISSGMKIDSEIEDIQDEKAFNKMVDERVKKIKGELQAPVYAQTMGDMWKDVRRFGSPCLLSKLRQEKSELKAQMQEAEENATVVEQQLQEARGDVKDAWYPPPPPPPKDVEKNGARTSLQCDALAKVVGVMTFLGLSF